MVEKVWMEENMRMSFSIRHPKVERHQTHGEITARTVRSHRADITYRRTRSRHKDGPCKCADRWSALSALFLCGVVCSFFFFSFSRFSSICSLCACFAATCELCAAGCVRHAKVLHVTREQHTRQPVHEQRHTCASHL